MFHRTKCSTENICLDNWINKMLQTQQPIQNGVLFFQSFIISTSFIM